MPNIIFTENPIYEKVSKGFQGTGLQVLAPGVDGYEDSLVRWSDSAQKAAAAVVFPRNADEVSRIVKLLRANEIEFVVSGGRHSTSGASSIDNGVVIDMRKMNSVVVDEKNKTVEAGGGCIWKEVDEEAAKYGLAAVGGTVNHTGVGGLTLGGGFGWLSPRHGLVIDNLLRCTLVLADGTVTQASTTENTDLFWAVRGAGSSFAICTSFVFRAHEQKTPVWGGMLAFPPTKIDAIVAFANKFLSVAKEEAFVIGCANPPPHFQPAILTILFYNGPEEKGREFYADLFKLEPLVDMTHAMPYEKLNAMFDGVADYGGRKTMASAAVKYPIEAQLVKDTYEKHARFTSETEGTEGGIAMFFLFPNEKSESVPLESTAYGNRGQYYHFEAMTRWSDPSLDQTCRAYARGLGSMIRERGGTANERGVGAYANTVEQQMSAKKIFGVNAERLKELKAKYDPDNVFRRWHDVFHVDKI